jgi:hypothetical protein
MTRAAARYGAALGPDTKAFTVQEVADGVAQGVDQMGRALSVTVKRRMGKGSLPRPGEIWLLERSYFGRWSFGLCVSALPPTVSGSRGGNAALASLLSALDAAGLIVDATTA